MILLAEIVGLISNYLIKGIFISVLVIICSRKIFKKNFDTRNAITIVRWILLCYSILALVYFLLCVLLPTDLNTYSSYFRERATGPYSFAFWTMQLTAFLPLVLFFKNLSNKIYMILMLAILVNIGWLFESFVIHLTIMRRDYSGETGGFKAYLPFNKELMIVLQGLVLGVLTFIVGNSPLFKKKERRMAA